MLKLGALVQIHDREDPRRSDTTLLAAALLTLGYPRAGRNFLYTACETARGETRWKTTWTFHGQSAETSLGKLAANKVIKVWRGRDGNWLLQNPGHAVTVLRIGLRYDRLASFTPKFSRAELARIATPDTWLEAGFRNLVHVLRRLLPAAMAEARSVVRFSAQRAAFVPRCFSEAHKTRLLKFAETTDHAKRRSILAA